MGTSRYNTGGSLGPPVGSAAERRVFCRYSVVHADALVGWWDAGKFESRPGRLLNLSLNGCMVELPKLPGRAPGESIWLYPLGLGPTEWIEAVLVAAVKPLLKNCRVRMSFVAPFPYQSFKKLVYGAGEFQHAVSREAPAHECDHYWK